MTANIASENPRSMHNYFKGFFFNELKSSSKKLFFIFDIWRDKNTKIIENN